MEKQELSEQAMEARRAYYRAWAARNKDKVREKNRRYWERRAEKQAQSGPDRPA